MLQQINGTVNGTSVAGKYNISAALVFPPLRSLEILRFLIWRRRKFVCHLYFHQEMLQTPRLNNKIIQKESTKNQRQKELRLNSHRKQKWGEKDVRKSCKLSWKHFLEWKTQNEVAIKDLYTHINKTNENEAEKNNSDTFIVKGENASSHTFYIDNNCWHIFSWTKRFLKRFVYLIRSHFHIFLFFVNNRIVLFGRLRNGRRVNEHKWTSYLNLVWQRLISLVQFAFHRNGI